MKPLSARALALSVFLAAAAAGAALLSACAKNPAATEDSSRQDEASARAQADADSLAAAMLLPAYRLNREAATHARLASLKSGSEPPQPQPAGLLPALGAAPSASKRDLAPRPRPDIAAALLKRGALGKGSAATGSDSSWIDYGDSAQGHILWVHAYFQAVGGSPVEARDTLAYKWPSAPGSRPVLGHAGARVYADGSRLAYAFTDEDGDGLLNEAAGGVTVKLRKQWITVRGDTAWKSVHHTVHGLTNAYDSIGAGRDTGWTDSVFVGGKVVAWQRLMDGDKDGFVLTAAPGKQVRVNRDAYEEVGAGLYRVDQESFGPGADGDFLTADDNERYPFDSRLIDAQGRTLSASRYGDADGDGCYFDPAAGAGKNRAWAVNEYPAGDSAKAWADSLVQILSGPGGADAQVAFYAASRAYRDGRRLSAFFRAPGKDAFGGSDTAQYWEKWDMTGWAAADGADSSLRVTWMIPGILGDPSDDKITQTYSQTWRKPGGAYLSVSELLTAESPFPPGQAPGAGAWTREERRSPVSSKSVIRSVTYREFDRAQGKSDWRRTDYYESGEASLSQGSGALGGAGSYVLDLGPGARSSGTYDAATGVFADTTAFLDPKGGTRAREITWGQIDAAQGTGDYQVKRLGGQDVSTAHVKAMADGKAIVLTQSGGPDTLNMRLEGDSAVLVKARGGVARTYVWSSEAGAYKVTERDTDAGGAAIASGEYYFGQDLSGSGLVRKTPAGKPAAESRAQFQSDGSLFLDGIRVYP